MSLHQNVADATLRIECGDSRGSGFHLITPDLIISNYHVVNGFHTSGSPINGITEKGNSIGLELVGYSPIEEYDFAILRTEEDIPESQKTLSPIIVDDFQKGMDILFSGFPHGIPHLLVQDAIISGQISEDIFYIDGSVNGGNSGGPIINQDDGSVIGIVTQRRFLGSQDLENLSKSANELRKHCQIIAGRGSVQIMGIDFGRFSQLMAEAMILIQDVIQANANTGIGIGYSIKHVLEECEELGIIT